MRVCPFCGGRVVPAHHYDEEGVEGWTCDDCEAWTVGLHEDSLPDPEEWEYHGTKVTVA